MVNYDPQKVITIVDNFVLTGFAEDAMVEVSRMSDKRNSHVGAQGNVTFSVSADDRAEATITLKDTSPANDKMFDLYKKEEEFGFSVIDQNFDGDVSGSGSRCVIQNLPDNVKSNEPGDREWVLLVADYDEAFEGVL